MNITDIDDKIILRAHRRHLEKMLATVEGLPNASTELQVVRFYGIIQIFWTDSFFSQGWWMLELVLISSSCLSECRPLALWLVTR